MQFVLQDRPYLCEHRGLRDGTFTETEGRDGDRVRASGGGIRAGSRTDRAGMAGGGLVTTSAPALVVAIDGPSGTGKSTVARRLASDLGLAYLDTGAMYRALAWWCLEEGTDLTD